jgi:phosphoenolpyruvate-protein phosphotransferase
VATLGALRGHRVQVQAAGPQAHEAVEHLIALAGRSFDEPDHHEAGTAAGGPPSAVNGAAPPVALGASPGIGIGPVRRVVLEPARADDEAAAGPPSAQWRRVVEAVAEVRREVDRLRVVTAREVGSQEAGIFDAHLMLLGDAELLGDVKRGVELGQGAAAAWAAALSEVERQWAALPDPYLQARAEDVRAVGDQVLRVLSGSRPARLDAAGVVVARELTPGQAAELDAGLVEALVLAGGSPTSHVAILARARGIPAVVGAGPSVLGIAEGTTIVVDGSTGQIVVDPPAGVLRRFRAAAAALARTARRDLAGAAAPAVTRDGSVIEVAANVGSVADASTAMAAGADSVGLLRTEFLFLHRDRAPTAAEQEREYRQVAAAVCGRRVTIRTLDAGGDKPLPYLALTPEQNPFLGLRGIRLALARPELLADQLVAACRTAAQTPVDLMFPMISTVEELTQARAALLAAAGPSGLPPGLRVGMMVEVPAAALTVESFLPLLDFVSIGTNDLTQYTLAAERGNPSVAYLADALQPAVLRLIAAVCTAASGRVPVAVCGEAAADPMAIPVLLGLGVTELSVSPHAVPGVKRAVRELDLAWCTDLAAAALRAASAAEVRDLVGAQPRAAGRAAAGTARTGAA